MYDLPPPPTYLCYVCKENYTRCNKQEIQIINDIILSLSKESKASLLFKHKKRLEMLGKQIDHIHPLKFLSIIFLDPNLKNALILIEKDYFKWKNFYSNLSKKLNEKARKNELLPYLEEFSKEVNVPKEKIKPFIEQKNWQGFINFFIYT